MPPFIFTKLLTRQLPFPPPLPLLPLLLTFALAATSASSSASVASFKWPTSSVYVLDPSTPKAQLQALVDHIYTLHGGKDSSQKHQFSDLRTLILLLPGTYDIKINVGYYTSVAGLGATPEDVTVTSIQSWDTDGGVSTDNFWRSVENLSIRPPAGQTNTWSVSQACPLRRVHVYGNLNLFQQGWSSGGFLADSLVDGRISPGSQQQYFVRNTKMREWTSVNWSEVFLGCTGNFHPYCNDHSSCIALPSTPRIAQKPTLFVDSQMNYKVLRPHQVFNSGPTTNFNTGDVIDIGDFFVAEPGDSAAVINMHLENGQHILLTPGIYRLAESIIITKNGSMVLGYGFPTLISSTSQPCMIVKDVPNVIVSGILFQAAGNVSTLLQWGTKKEYNPGYAYDIFARVGGSEEKKVQCDAMVTINSNGVVGDDFWLWRADHGNGVGWDMNIAKHALVINGDNVTMYSLAGEHCQGDIIVWNGDHGSTYFFQSEMAYDGASGGSDWEKNVVAYRVTGKNHQGYGIGCYTFFHSECRSSNAIITPDDSKLVNPFAVSFLKGGFDHVWNNEGDATSSSHDYSYICSQ